jgi:hypothetical protein
LIDLNLIACDDRALKTYKKLLNINGYHATKELTLDLVVDASLKDISIIDIKDSSDFNMLKKISFDEKGFVILVSPLAQNHIKSIENINPANIFVTSKPLNIDKFISLVKDCEHQVKKKLIS